MKASIFASVLSLCVISIPANAINNPPKSLISNACQSSPKIDLNKAGIQTLSKSIKGIGQKRAEAIVKYREEHGKFMSVKDLSKVKGFSSRFVEKHLKQLQDSFLVN